MSAQQEDGRDELTDRELQTAYLQRARAMMMDFYSQDETAVIYGLHLDKVESQGDLWDVFHVEGGGEDSEGDVQYIDTIDISHFATAGQILQQLGTYFPDDEAAEAEPDDQGEVEEPDPTRTFH